MQHHMIYEARISALHTEAEKDRLAREAVKADVAQSLADRVAERARRWVKAA